MDIAIMIEAQNGLTWPRWQKIAAAVEDLGFAGLYRSDHFTNAGPPDMESLELWVSLSWLASRRKTGKIVKSLLGEGLVDRATVQTWTPKLATLWCVNAGHCRPKIVEAIRKQAGIQSLESFVELGLPEEFLAQRDGAIDYVGALQCFLGFGEQIRHLGLVRQLAVRRVQTSYRLAKELERIVAPWSWRGGSHFGIGCGDGLAFPGENLRNHCSCL